MKIKEKINISKKIKTPDILIEWNRQTQNNLDAIDQYTNLFETFPATNFNKIESFTRHVRRQTLSKFLSRTEIFKQTLDVCGSVVELGVCSGQSLFTWAQLSAILEPLNYTRQIIGFDSFTGIPHISAVDQGKKSSEHIREGGFCFSEIDALEEAIQVYDSNRFINQIQKIELVKGDICKTLPRYLKENPHLVVSLLHIDADVYAPTKTALEVVVPRMPKGSIIVFDELNQVLYPGETQALCDTLGISSLKLQRFTWEPGICYVIL